MQTQMNEMRTEMDGHKSQIAEVHAQNQFLLSKISALSSVKAPAIFEGVDRRKLERKQEKLRQSGQSAASAVRQRQLAFFVRSQFCLRPSTLLSRAYILYALLLTGYGIPVSQSVSMSMANTDDACGFRMWLIPVGTLLQCESLPSHQEALRKGMLGNKPARRSNRTDRVLPLSQSNIRARSLDASSLVSRPLYSLTTNLLPPLKSLTNGSHSGMLVNI